MSRFRAGWLLLATSASALAADPFAGVQPAAPESPAARPSAGWRDNLLFRKEVYWAETAGADDFRDTHDVYSRLSAGFEVQKRFATATKTVASFDFQGRVVFRDHWLDTASDPMGMDAGTWEYETHNAYAEFYNLFGTPGRFNLRAGRFYLPFGLNGQTDTHGTLLQLSNDRVFGTERDWQVTAYGNATEHLDYMAGYVLGTVLTVTPETVDYNNKVILKMADPDGYAGLKTALDAAALRLKQERVTTIWVPRKEEVSEQDKRVKVSGKLKTFIADKLTSEREKDYLVEFTITTSGRLYVSKIEEIVKRDPSANKPAGN